MSLFGVLKLFPFLKLHTVFTIKLNNFDVSGPKFLSTPSVTIGDDGLSYIVGCKYVVEERQVDLAVFAYLVVNQTIKRKLNGSSRRLSEDTFQLPQHLFIVPGEYQCLIEAKGLYKESIYSNLSAYISMPGRIIWLYWNFVNQKIVTQTQFQETKKRYK